jgi:hypothetical protein
MSKKFFTLTLFGLLAGSAAYAQTGQSLQADVPFAFTVRDATLPAGAYRLTFAPSTHVLRIQGVQEPADNLIALAAPESDPQGAHGAARLVFHCQGKECYLAQVWNGSGSASGVRVPESNRQRRLSFQTRIISMTMVK